MNRMKKFVKDHERELTCLGVGVAIGATVVLYKTIPALRGKDIISGTLITNDETGVPEAFEIILRNGRVGIFTPRD